MIYQVENFRKWVNETKLRIVRPNTMTKHGAVLDDFGLDSMLDKLIEGFILPLSKGKAIYDFNALETLLLVITVTLNFLHSVVLQYSSSMCVDQL